MKRLLITTAVALALVGQAGAQTTPKMSPEAAENMTAILAMAEHVKKLPGS
jgi:hypothetical protein